MIGKIAGMSKELTSKMSKTPILIRILIIAISIPFIYLSWLNSATASIVLGLLLAIVAYIPANNPLLSKFRIMLLFAPVFFILLLSIFISLITYSGEIRWFGYLTKVGIIEYVFQALVVTTNWLFVLAFLLSCGIMHIVNIVTLRFSSQRDKGKD